MIQAIRRDIIIQTGGRVQFDSAELKEGMRAEVIVILKESSTPDALSSFIGKGKGAFKTPHDVDNFLCSERKSWG